MNRMTMNRNGFGSAAQVADRPHLAGDPLPVAGKTRRKHGAVLTLLNKLPFAPTVGVLFAGVGAILALATPLWLMEYGIARSGLPDLLPAAAPPLGGTARVLATALSSAGWGAGAFLVLWFGSKVFALGPRRANVTNVPAESHDDDADLARFDLPDRAPAPLTAEELGSPLMSDEALDLGTALALPPNPDEMMESTTDVRLTDVAPDAAFDTPADEGHTPAVVMVPVTDAAPSREHRAADEGDTLALLPVEGAAPQNHHAWAETHLANAPALDTIDDPDVAMLLQRLEFGLARMQFAGRSKPVPPLGRDALLDRMAAGTL